MTKKLISIVTPFFNEEAGIEKYFLELEKTFKKIPQVSYEIIAIDDGSLDATFSMLKAIAAKNKNIKIIKLSRNFGKEIALSAGLDYAFGDAVIPMDADLQDAPSAIAAMIEKWQEGYKVVLAQRFNRQDPFLKKFTAKIFYKIASKIMDFALPSNVGDFRLMDKIVVVEIRKMRERTRFMRGILSWVGYKTATIKFERPQRLSGKTKYNYKAIINYALDGIFSFSTFPIRLITYFGFFISLFSFAYLIYILIAKLVFGQGVAGYASIMSVILFFSGINFIFIGAIGEYVGRIFNEVKQRPLYIVEELVE
jgi:glycosyltransferase involved in cell wall biosynthesis